MVRTRRTDYPSVSGSEGAESGSQRPAASAPQQQQQQGGVDFPSLHGGRGAPPGGYQGGRGPAPQGGRGGYGGGRGGYGTAQQQDGGPPEYQGRGRGAPPEQGERGGYAGAEPQEVSIQQEEACIQKSHLMLLNDILDQRLELAYRRFEAHKRGERELQNRVAELEQEICEGERLRKQLQNDIQVSTQRCEVHKRRERELQNRVAELEQKILEGEKLRKKLHNDIQELKGNIRVFCRVRPLIRDDATEVPVISYPTSIEDIGRGIELVQNGKRHPFTFDKVFDHAASQQDVFVEISQLVQSALDGYKVCIFAYGQIGSGKTYTMMGSPETPDQKGLIPRSLDQIFQRSQSLQAQGWKYRMQVSMLEIYNETIHDLSSTNRPSGTELRRTESGVGKQLKISVDAAGNACVPGLTIIDVGSKKEISSLLQQAAQSRSVGKTHMNEQSSRSHLVFTLLITGFNESTLQQVQGVLKLIDLAGSARLSTSGSTGDCQKETIAINKSLSALKDVVTALLQENPDHVPYRNSKLTHLLQPCLGGDSKTLMFVNVSPESTSVGESLASLRFGMCAKNCKPRKARPTTKFYFSPDSGKSISSLQSRSPSPSGFYCK